MNVKEMGWTCVLLALLQPAMAQAARPTQDVRVLSARWAEYYATVYRVPVELVEAIISEESGWDPYAVSEKGAVGVMQLMPQTAVRFGVRNRFRLDCALATVMRERRDWTPVYQDHVAVLFVKTD